ncbi:hypothetical protein M758_1G130300 [Ceratodon purpureus]|uniref:Secreted protein n=1 Tax=Ceratodon purpureus TaxID=3225 RepID=A0A8T0J5Q0_CERPU|nr:hypothetical protein KC19_1G135500 [Ceratodon purpureus]KAG0629788.1 hypothetical protein M758_1G130300 [Ceratodon purpureus]
MFFFNMILCMRWFWSKSSMCGALITLVFMQNRSRVDQVDNTCMIFPNDFKQYRGFQMILNSSGDKLV